MSKKFQMVCGLWVTPDFSAVTAGRAAPPRVNHSAVDFGALHAALVELFPYGPAVQIQVPNDTIDQVTLHTRDAAAAGPTIRCGGFGAALLRAAKARAEQVLDVRAAWSGLHFLPDRDFAPPPSILPFVVTAVDFEDAMIWHSSTPPCIGLPPFDPLAEVTGQPRQDNGTLPATFLKRLAAIFGAPFAPMCVLDRMATDRPPHGYGLDALVR